MVVVPGRRGVASVLIQDGFAEVLTRRGISVFGERRRSLRLPLISDVGNLRLFAGSPDLEVHTSAAAETAPLLGLVAINAAPGAMAGTLRKLLPELALRDMSRNKNPTGEAPCVANERKQ